MSVGFAVQLSPVPMVDYVSYHTDSLGLHCDQLASSLFTCLVRHAPRVWKLHSVAQVESGKWLEICALIEIFSIPKIRVTTTRYSGPEGGGVRQGSRATYLLSQLAAIHFIVYRFWLLVPGRCRNSVL